MAKTGRYTIKTKDIIIKPRSEGDIWEGIFDISVKEEDKFVNIGTATFSGEKILGAVPLSVNLDEEYRNKGYGTRVYKLMTDFAFGFKNIYEVVAVTDSDNDKCVYALEKAGFIRRKKEGKVETYSITKPKSVWLGLYVYIGIILGLIIGIVIGILWVGMVIGLFIGIAIGMAMDSRENKERQKITGSSL